MQKQLTVTLSPIQEFQLTPDSQMAPDEGRRWLDEQFIELDCEPLRASGKVLLADKVLAIATAAGPELLGQQAWGERFAAATIAALGQATVQIDVSSASVNF